MKPVGFVLHEDPTNRRWSHASFMSDDDTERGRFKTLGNAKLYASERYGIDPEHWEEQPGFSGGIAFYYAFTRHGHRFEINPQCILGAIKLNAGLFH